MKKIYYLLTAIPLITLVSCVTEEPRINSYLNDKGPINLMGKDIKISYTSEWAEKNREIEEYLIKEIPLQAKSIGDIRAKINGYLERIYYLKDQAYYARILSLYDSKYSEILGEINVEYNNMVFSLDSFKNESLDTIYQDVFFGELSDEELNDLKLKLDMKTNPRILELNNQMSMIQNEYSYKDTNADEMIIEFKDYANEYAHLMSYDNFLSYSYQDDYERDYSYQDTLKIKNAIKNYIIPKYKEYEKELDKLKESLSDDELDEIDQMFRYFGPYKYLCDSYAKAIGNEYERYYRHLWKTGNYFFSAESSHNTSAYSASLPAEKQAIVVFSGDYQGLNTFIHEFGHYNAFYTSSTFSLDTAEIHSQGNEMLFSRYLETSDLSQNVKDYYRLDSIIDKLNSIIIGYIVNEFEIDLYEDKLQADNLFSSFQNILKEYSFSSKYLENYYRRVVINDAGYYISYSTSAISSLELYSMSLTSFDKAKETYLGIAKTKVGYLETLKNVGLASPFEEKTIETIAKSL